ncbi:hypothetical protein HETIRDRAFT_473515 [Heterobasidion irregulare TC 32-1]|uniref:NmrA-like domain-containing protein n=1 Tax=Heterobasidion irregulare (strain TC 32-1) TaxID=747525 RepID=W4KGG6_HETIT|nr:uncharacterized protein HETIRDRAFT_473515 [Heterobasidion irregulare TC 32-1]ETW84794.1 hypothetical protein HETIRDRAFT_473515 [Heterobasidion irregulare TC 32-1]
MSTYKNFAVAGVGNIGRFIAEELLNQKAAGKANEIVILTRKGSNNAAIEALATRGAKIAAVDYDSVSNLALALANVDVVVSALGYAAIFAQQLNLASASKLANVSLFVPSQYGLPDRTGIPSEDALRDKLEGVALSSFFVGVFTDSLFKYATFAGLILEKGEAVVPGDGTPSISFTDRRDVGRYVAYVLTTLRPSNLVDRQFRIEGQRASLNAIIDEYQTFTGKTVKVTYLATEDLKEALKKNPNDVISAIRLAWATGKGVVGEESELANSEYLEWKPKSVLESVVGAL